MGATNTTTELAGLYKIVYPNGIESVVPDNAVFQQLFPFDKKDTQGSSINVPVIVSNEQGFTYAASGQSTAIALGGSVAGLITQASVTAPLIVLQSRMNYEAAEKAASSKGAFKEATTLIFENMMNSMSREIEMGCIYGGSAYATTLTTNWVSGFTTGATGGVLGISDATWSSYWCGATGKVVSFTQSGTTTLISSGADAAFTITKVDVTNKRITVSCTATGNDALRTYLATTGNAVDIYPYGAHSTGNMTGIDKAITTATTLWGIDPATYDGWSGASYAISGNISLVKIFNALAVAQGRGLTGDAVIMLNPAIWSNLMALIAAKQNYDYSYSVSKGTYGFNAVELGSATGKVTVVSNPMVKVGDGFIVPKKKVKRVGACDIKFNDSLDGKIFFHLENYAAVEMRCMSIQTPFVMAPAQCVKLTGITVATS